MGDDASPPVALPYVAPLNAWPRRVASLGVAASVLFILLIVPLGMMDFRVGSAAAIVFLALPLVALALGLAARARSSREAFDVHGRARWAIVLGAAELAILLGIALPMQALWRSQETANRVKCRSQIRAIGQMILLYSNDHRGQWPPTLAVLITESDITPEVFICPSSSDVPAAGATTQQMVAAFSVNPKHCSYVYLGPPPPRGMQSVPPADVVVAHERLINHDGNGMNVLFGDGHVEWLNLSEAKHLLAELQAGRNPPLPLMQAASPSSSPVSAR